MAIYLTILLLVVISCKQLPDSQTTTISSSKIAEINEKYTEYMNLPTGIVHWNELIDLEKEIGQFLANNPSTETQALIEKQHLIRSFLATIKMTKCLTKKEGWYELKTDHLCSIIVKGLQSLASQSLSLTQSQSNQQFYQEVLAGQHDKFYFTDETQGHRNIKQQREWYHTVNSAEKNEFFQALVVEILAIIEQTMQRHQRMFPTNKDWVNFCVEARAVRNTQNQRECAQLARLTGNDQVKYQDLKQLAVELNGYIDKLNKTRKQINNIVATPVRFGQQPTVKENLWFIPLFNVVNVVHPEMVTLHEKHQTIIFDSAKDGLLPILLDKYGKSLYLNQRGQFAGLGNVHYSMLSRFFEGESSYYSSQKFLRQRINNLNLQLAKVWLATKQAISENKSDQEIYLWLISNEIATARVLARDPRQAKVVGYLLANYQNASTTPKLLQVSKTVTHRFDISMIAISIVGGIMFPPAGVALAIIATTANFLWVANATADAVVAHSRYKRIEQAILTGNSQQVKAGLKLLDQSKNKLSKAIFSGTVGTLLSASSIRGIAKGVDSGVKFLVTDASAAIAAEIFTGQEVDILGNFEVTPETEKLLEDDKAQ